MPTLVRFGMALVLNKYNILCNKSTVIFLSLLVTNTIMYWLMMSNHWREELAQSFHWVIIIWSVIPSWIFVDIYIYIYLNFYHLRSEKDIYGHLSLWGALVFENEKSERSILYTWFKNTHVSDNLKIMYLYWHFSIAAPQTSFTQPPVWWWAILSSEVLYYYYYPTTTTTTTSTTTLDKTFLHWPTEKNQLLGPYPIYWPQILGIGSTYPNL